MRNASVAQGVEDLMALSPRRENPFLPKKSEMLGEVRLGDPQCPSQVVHAPLPLHQLHEKLEADRMAQDPQTPSSPIHFFLIKLLFNIHDIRILKH